MTKQIQVGKFYLIDRELYQLVQPFAFKICMIHIQSGNRLKDPIPVPSNNGFLTRPIIDQHTIDQVIPTEYQWQEVVTITIMYQHEVTTVTTKIETFTI